MRGRASPGAEAKLGYLGISAHSALPLPPAPCALALLSAAETWSLYVDTECPFGAPSIVSPLIALLLGTLIISFSSRLNQSY